MANASLGTLEVQIGADTTGLKEAEKEVKATSKTMQSSFSAVGKTIAAALTVEAATRAIKIADNMTRLEAVVKRLTKTTGDFNSVWNELNEVSDANGVAIGESIALFQRFQTSLKNVTDQNGEVVDFIDTLQKIGRIGGSSSQEMSNALVQLSQGLSGGVIRAEEFNSLIEQTPEILTVAAKNIDGVNGDLGKLRKQMLDGKLTAEIFYAAISKGAADVDKEFAELPKTIDQTLTKLTNSFSRFLLTIEKTTSIANAIATSFDGMADAMNKVNNLMDSGSVESMTKRMQELNTEITEQKALIDKLESEGVGIFDALFGDTDIRFEKRQLQELKDEYKELQKLIGIPGITKEPGAKPTGPVSAAPVKSTTPAVINIDDEVAKLELLAGVYDDKFAEIEADILRKRQEAIKLYGESSAEFLEIDEQLNQNRIDAYIDAEDTISEKINEENEARREATEKIAEQQAAAFEALNNHIGNQLGDAITKAQSFSDAFKNIMSNLLGQLISAGITAGFGGSVGGGNVFSSLFATGGGNAFGGGVSPIAAHRVNERGTPEMLNQAGKQYLLPNGKGGSVTPLSSSSGKSQPNISMINMGTPMNVENVNITEEGIEVMINDRLASFDKALTAEMSRPNSTKGRALKNTFKLEQNLRR